MGELLRRYSLSIIIRNGGKPSVLAAQGPARLFKGADTYASVDEGFPGASR
jgi:hypothetical protein